MVHLLQDIKFLGRYQLLRVLGRGGMSTVYLAKDTQLDRQVAIKCVENTTHQAKFVARLQLEAKMLAQLNHPNIVQLYDVIEHEHILGLVIEFVEGHSLVEKRRVTSIDYQQGIDWLIQIAHGLEYAHDAGIVHCDLKPENILVTPNNAVKIADFGIAKAMLGRLLDNNGLTEIDKVSGSYFSLSPEQATGQKVDYRSDLFSLGILIHLLLTNEHPFGDTQNHFMVVQRIINEPFSVSPQAQDRLTAEHTHLIRTLLNKDPRQRHYHASDVAALLGNSRGNVITGESTYYDATQELPIINRTAIKKSPINVFTWAAPLIALLAVMAAVFYWVSQPTEMTYVALAKPTIVGGEQFGSDRRSQIQMTLEQSAQQALIDIPNIGLIPSGNFEGIVGNITQKAIGSGANVVITLTANCMQTKCDLRLQKLKGEQMLLVQQETWPVLANSLVDIRASLLNEVASLFAMQNRPEGGPTGDINESDYRRYLAIHDATSAGTTATHANLLALEELQAQSPFFQPVYSLYTQAAVHLFKESGEHRYLDQLSKLLSNVPNDLRESAPILRLEFDLLLQKNEVENAHQLLTEIRSLSSNQVFHNDLEGSLAYAQNDYARMLQLDRENATLMPSAWRYYNLATSEYTVGNFAEAAQATENALSLYPNHLYSLDLSAAIALSQGYLDKAVTSYQRIPQEKLSSDSLSNYGLALALSGDFDNAIVKYLQAIEKNASNPNYWLNLADGYDLSGQEDMATQSYKKVLEQIKRASTAQEYSIRAQAQAHLGEFNQSIKTLKTANELFPSISELDYAAAIVHTLAGNENAAIVEVENALESGTGAIWFQFDWFKPLCRYPQFAAKIHIQDKHFCAPVMDS